MSGEQVVAQRVRQVITESGLSQAEFAAKAGLDGPKMSKSLSGVRRFTSLDLARIAEVGGVTVDYLLGSEVPAPTAAARSVVACSADVAVDKARELAQLRSDLAFLGYPQSRRSVGARPKTGRLIDQGARLAAEAVAFAQGQGHDPCHNRDLGDLVEKVFGIDVAAAELPDGFDGLAWTDANTQLILVGTSRVAARQRFTIAHELGHLLAGDDQQIHVDTDLYAEEHRKKPSEIRANAFASAFLLPEGCLQTEVTGIDWSPEAFAKLVCRLWVSPSTLAWRLLNLGLINARQCTGFRQMSYAQAAERAGQMDAFAEWIGKASSPSVPLALVRDTYRAYADGKSTLRPFAKLLGIDTDTLRQTLDEVWEEPRLTP
ncbi:MAG TPA: XRE family transcriptional regulator [Streptosporangiaceae bacterium]|nr:XRE family transcriptional regulator [Streptosporangiaceae bacterium]